MSTRSLKLSSRKTFLFSANSQIKHLVPESLCPELGHLVSLFQSPGPPVGEVKPIPIKGLSMGNGSFLKKIMSTLLPEKC